MKTPRIANAVGNIDDDLIIKSENSSNSKKKSPWIKWTTFAACLMIFAVVGALFIPMLRGAKSEDEVDREDMNGIYSETPNGEAKSILNAWSGELTVEKLKRAIKQYSKNYTNIVLDKNTDFTVSFETDFEIVDCSVIRVSAVDKNDIDFELDEGGFNFSLEASFNNKTVKTSILNFDSSMEKYPVVSYVVCVNDVNGIKHYYYFRVDYSNLTKTQIRGEQLLLDGEITDVEVSSLPEYYNYSFNGESAKKIVDYLSSLNLESDFEENPNEYGGMTWVVSLKYENGDALTVYHAGNMFIRAENGTWYKMTYEEASRFHTLLDELNK